MKSCLKCPNHNVIPDPDPNDWFCGDDKAIVCLLDHNSNYDPRSKWASDRQRYRAVTVSCRPYHLKDESDVPEWCPLGHGFKRFGELNENVE